MKTELTRWERLACDARYHRDQLRWWTLGALARLRGRCPQCSRKLRGYHKFDCTYENEKLWRGRR